MKKAKNRFIFFAVIASLSFTIVFLRITYLTFFTETPRNSAASPFKRGPITDRNGLTLAVTEEASTIGIAPDEIPNPEFTARSMSSKLDMSPEEILEKIYHYKNRKYFLLKRHVDNFKAERLLELSLPGVYRESEFIRFYPGNSLASNLIGFVGRDQEAFAGIERIYNDVLSLPTTESAKIGSGLQLTIDSVAQYRLEQLLYSQFLSTKSKRASAVFMDLKNGEIIAMANLPTFDPNRYYTSKPEERRNWAMRFNYEPGSTVKVLMAAMVLQERAVKSTDHFLCEGEIQYKDIRVRCKHNNRTISHGSLTLEEIIKLSCNVGIIKAMQKIPREKLHFYLERLGFGKRTNALLGLGETPGYLPDLDNWHTAAGYYAPIGQGFSVTPLQLLRAVSSIAAQGKLYKPMIVKYIKDSNGKVVDESAIDYEASPFEQSVNERIKKMMRLVVTNGTGVRANIPEVEIAGKTGTGQKSSASGYQEKYIASFVGFFPADNPRYSGLILFDEPEDGQVGGTAAAPVFAEFAKTILPVLDAKPESAQNLTKAGIAHDPVKNVSSVYLSDYRGLSAREALDVARAQDLPVRLNGSGYVKGQNPEPGTKLSDVNEIILDLGE